MKIEFVYKRGNNGLDEFMEYDNKTIDSICIYTYKNDCLKVLYKLEARIIHLTMNIQKIPFLHFNIDLNQKGIFRYCDSLYIPVKLSGLKYFHEDELTDPDRWNQGYWEYFTLDIFKENLKFYSLHSSPSILNLKDSIMSSLAKIYNRINEDIYYLDDDSIEKDLDTLNKNIKDYNDLKEKYFHIEDDELLKLFKKEIEDLEEEDSIGVLPYEEEFEEE